MTKAKAAAAKEQAVRTPLQNKFYVTQQEIAKSLIERDDEITLALTAMLAGENALIVGPPGVAKSLLVQSICKWLNGRYFDVLLTKFSTPEEVFGPVSVQGLKQDQYRRITTGYLPEADIAFLDEIFKASSAILNTFLRVLNERQYVNGGTTYNIPLLLAIAASNEWPNDQEGGKELGALFDRFVLRKYVKPISTPMGRKRLLWTDDHTPQLSTTITPKEVLDARKEALALKWTPESMETMERIIRELNNNGVTIGDRRQFKAVKVARAYAYLAGANAVAPEHLEILGHVLWSDPAEQAEKTKQLVAKLSNPTGAKLTEWAAESEQIISETNLQDPQSVTAAARKLGEILNKVSRVPASPKQEQLMNFLTENQKEFKLKAIEAMGI